MSLITSPAVGFPDDQQQPQWQSPLLISDSNTLGAGVLKTYTTLKVANWQSTQIAATSNAGNGVFTLSWYADSGLTKLLGSKVFVIENQRPATVAYPNVGPYLSIQVTAGSLGMTYTLYVNATNRSAPAWATAGGDILIEINSTNINPGALLTASAQTVYAGMAQFQLLTAASGWEANLKYKDINQADHIVNSWNTTVGTPAQPVNQLIMLPAFPLRLEVTNHAGVVATFWAHIVIDVYH